MVRKIYYILIFFIISIPITILILKKGIDIILRIDKPLVGAYVNPERPEISIQNVLNGSFQKEFEIYFNYNLIGRSTMTRIYNQLLYSLFNSTENSTIITGPEGYLFQPWDFTSFFTEIDSTAENALLNKMKLLAKLQEKLENIGKSSLVIFTPKKTSFYSEYIPASYRRYFDMKINKEYSRNFYESFVMHASEMGISFYDAHELFLDQKRRGKEMFTKGGAHWTGTVAVPFFNQMIEELNRNLESKIGIITIIKETPVWGHPFITDGDLVSLLNLFSPHWQSKINVPLNKIFPQGQYFSSHIETVSNPTQNRPSVFIVGGSFNWTILSMIYGVNGWIDNSSERVFGITEFSYYNRYVTRYPENVRIAETTDNYASILEKDIIIIEFNESQISPWAEQFVFIENLLAFMENR